MIDVLFINTTDKADLRDETNGTLILATKLLQAGISADVLRFYQIENYSYCCDYWKFIENITDEILKRNPKCVSFYTLWPYYHIMLRIAKVIKDAEPHINIVMGGPQASATAEDTMKAAPYVDYICTGEGENTVVPFFKTVLENKLEDLGEIPALYYRKNGEVVYNHFSAPVCDINAVPYWDERLIKDVYENSKKKALSDDYFMPIDAGRGCPYGCTFCSSSRFWHRAYRLKSAERIIADIEYYGEKFGITSFNFSHDAFTANKKLVEEICDSIIEKGLKIHWKCTTRINCITEELIIKMKRAGLTVIEMGIETGSERMQKLTKKNLNLEEVKKKVDFLLKNKIQTYLFFMYGFPEETEEDLNQTLELALGLYDKGVTYISLNFCNFNPNAAITEKYMDQLVFNPDVKILGRQNLGYEEEVDIIRNNRSIFPFFYHLDTPLRNEFQYLTLLAYIYKTLPNGMRYIRTLYKGDNIKLYRDLIKNNAELFSNDINTMIDELKKDMVNAAINIIRPLSLPFEDKICELLQYDFDRAKAKNEKTAFSFTKVYKFSALDLARKLPIEQFKDAETEILFENAGGKVSSRIVNIK